MNFFIILEKMLLQNLEQRLEELMKQIADNKAAGDYRALLDKEFGPENAPNHPNYPDPAAIWKQRQTLSSEIKAVMLAIANLQKN